MEESKNESKGEKKRGGGEKKRGGGAFGNPVLSIGAVQGKTEGPTTAAGQSDTHTCTGRWKPRASLGLHRCKTR